MNPLEKYLSVLPVLILLNQGFANGATIAVTQGSGTAILTKTDGAGANSPSNTLCDATNPDNCAPVDVTTGLAVHGTIAVSGTPTVAGTVSVSGTVPVSGTIAVSGTSAISGTATLAAGTQNVGSVVVTGLPAINVGSVNGTAISTANLPVAVVGTVPVSGTVGVSGTSAVSGTIAVSGTPTVAGTISVSGTVPVSGTVAATGTVGVSGTVPVSGTVGVSGTSAVSGTVTAQGTLANIVVLNFGFVAGTSTRIKNTVTISGTTTETLMAATASLHSYITDLMCFRTDAGTTLASVTFNDDNSTPFPLPPNSGAAMPINVPVVSNGTNATITFTSQAGITGSCTARGYVGTWISDDLPDYALPAEAGREHLAFLDLNVGYVRT